MSVDPLLNQLRYSNRSRVKDEINNLIKEFRTLLPRIAEFVHDNGAQSKLIVLSGTIPILYNGVQYNIPVDLFVCEEHPRTAPKLYVRPTSNMTVKHNHQHVSPDGLCYLPYIHEWTEQCNLTALIEIASSVFSIEPPLFSRPSGATATPISSPTHSSYSMYGSTHQQPAVATPSPYTAYSATSNASSSNMGRVSPAQITTTMAAVSISSNNNNSTKSAEEGRRLQLVDQVTMRLYEAIDQKQRKLRDDLDSQMAVSSKLSQNADSAAKALEDLRHAKTVHIEATATMTEQSAGFEKWSAEESAKPALQAEERLVPFDPLSAQLVGLHSDIHAIDDAFYYLERALASSRNETVDLNTFLKECRQLARRQFLSMAHLRKINAQCLQDEADSSRDAAAQQANMQPQTMASVPHPHAYQQQQYGGYGGGYASSAVPGSQLLGHQYSAVPYPAGAAYHK